MIVQLSMDKAQDQVFLCIHKQKWMEYVPFLHSRHICHSHPNICPFIRIVKNCMKHTYILKLVIIYLKFKFNRMSYVFCGFGFGYFAKSGNPTLIDLKIYTCSLTSGSIKFVT